MTLLRVTHIGGPTALLEWDGWRVLTDPTFDPPGARYRFGWGTASRKVTGPAVSVDELGPVDAVLLTHDHHADNLDVTGRSLLSSVPRVLTTVAGAHRIGAGALGLAPWATTVLQAPGRPDVAVVATPCRHGPRGSRPIVGDVVGFALCWAGQAHGAVWVSGDTVLYDGVRSVADRLEVGTALLHLGGVRFGITGPVRYTMTARDAVDLWGVLRPNVVLPVHYEGWSHFRDGQAAIEAALAAAPRDVASRFQVLPLGVPVEVVA